MLDIVLISLPYSTLDQINSAPAILRGVAQQNGFSARTIDAGVELYKLCNKDPDLFLTVQGHFISDDTNPELADKVTELYELLIQRIRELNPRYIGVSVFSVWGHRCSIEFLSMLKQAGLDCKVIAGGRGVSTKAYKAVATAIALTSAERMIDFGHVLKKRRLADHVVMGDGEDAILSILTGVGAEVDDRSDAFKSPVPDYSDYEFDNYLFERDKIGWPITGSKGCVRDCDFCDVRRQFGRYRYRSGSDIAEEMISVSKTTGARKFQFTDSLVNGGLKPFREFLEKMAEYNLANPERSIRWTGQYICRPSSQVPAEIYRLIAQAGGEGLTIGAEGMSDSVLLSMNKKTTVQALFDELDRFRENGITCILLLMVGHWSETWEDFQEHCKSMVRITPYVRSGTVGAVRLGNMMYIIEGTPAHDAVTANGIVLSEFDPGAVWWPSNNPTSTIKERAHRQLVTGEIARRLGIPTVSRFDDLYASLVAIDGKQEQIDDFYQQCR